MFSKTDVSLGANTYYQSEVTLTNMRTTPLTMEALTSGTIVVRNKFGGTQYSLDGGATKILMDRGPQTEIPVNAGDKVQFYHENDTELEFDYDNTKIVGGSANVKVYGNIMSLIIGDDFEDPGHAHDLYSNEIFKGLFGDEAADVGTMIDASGLLLPATTLSGGCYSDMFRSCICLIAAPELPATTLAEECYSGMFSSCQSLTVAPELPATTLKRDDEECKGCYRGMFENCISLTVAPELPATELVEECYSGMFNNCHNLSSVTCLATEIDATDCTKDWLSDAGNSVSGTKTFITPSATNWSSDDSGIPNGWTRVEP